MHNIKSVLIGLSLGIIILLSLAISVSIIYEDEVSQYLIEELNEYILSEVEVGDVNFTLIKKFPKLNILLMKIINGGGGWGACARVRRVDGGKLSGIKVGLVK